MARIPNSLEVVEEPFCAYVTETEGMDFGINYTL